MPPSFECHFAEPASELHADELVEHRAVASRQAAFGQLIVLHIDLGGLPFT